MSLVILKPFVASLIFGRTLRNLFAFSVSVFLVFVLVMRCLLMIFAFRMLIFECLLSAVIGLEGEEEGIQVVVRVLLNQLIPYHFIFRMGWLLFVLVEGAVGKLVGIFISSYLRILAT